MSLNEEWQQHGPAGIGCEAHSLSGIYSCWACGIYIPGRSSYMFQAGIFPEDTVAPEGCKLWFVRQSSKL